MSVPFPDPVVISALSTLPGLEDIGGRVSTVLDATLPAVRVTKVGDREPPSDWETTPLYQVEVWSSSEFEAGSLAWVIRNNWPTAAKQTVGSALVTGRWVAVDPQPSPDPNTDLFRSVVTVGIRLSGATP